MELVSFVGAPKWMKRLGTGMWLVEEEVRNYKLSQPNLRCDSGR